MRLLSMRLCEHDSNFCYFDGTNLRYLKSERLKKSKHHAYQDLESWKLDLKKVWNIDIESIDEVSIIADAWKYIPDGHKYIHFAEKINYLGLKCPVWQVNHHYAHALSNLHNTSDIDIIIDGYGDWDIAFSIYKEDQLIKVGKLSDYGSLGIEMTELGNRLGIQAGHYTDISGKLMGLQSYGNIEKDFLKLLKNYEIENIKKVFDYNLWIEYKKDELLAKFTVLDWIATVHYAVGNILVKLFSRYASKDSIIHYSGGVAQNVIWNTLLVQHFPKLNILPHCADEGLSIGGMEFLLRKNNIKNYVLENFPFCTEDESTDIVTNEIIEKTAIALSHNKIIAWYQGNGEIGPRALGNRSIIINAADKFAKEKINKIKNRENYRPFGATVLEECKNDIFENLPHNPYMLYVGKTKDKEKYASITHVDGTSRAQTITEKSNKSLYKLMKRFYNKTNIPVVLNTSLNIAGNPIASTTQEAITLFENSDIDVLVIGNEYYEKN
jgi:carbamoyltransferase